VVPAMSALLIIYKGDDGRVANIPFTYHDGQMMSLVEEIVDVLVGIGAAESVLAGVAADRGRIILEQRVKLQEQSDVIAALREPVGAMGI